MEQKINTRKTENGYYVEVLHDGKVIWTDMFETEGAFNRFISCCDINKKLGIPCLTQVEARKLLENGEYNVEIFYRHPLGHRFTSIFNHNARPELNEHGIEVYIVTTDGEAESRTVHTIDEAFQLIKDVEDGKI